MSSIGIGVHYGWKTGNEALQEEYAGCFGNLLYGERIQRADLVRFFTSIYPQAAARYGYHKEILGGMAAITQISWSQILNLLFPPATYGKTEFLYHPSPTGGYNGLPPYIDYKPHAGIELPAKRLHVHMMRQAYNNPWVFLMPVLGVKETSEKSAIWAAICYLSLLPDDVPFILSGFHNTFKESYGHFFQYEDMIERTKKPNNPTNSISLDASISGLISNLPGGKTTLYPGSFGVSYHEVIKAKPWWVNRAKDPKGFDAGLKEEFVKFKAEHMFPIQTAAKKGVVENDGSSAKAQTVRSGLRGVRDSMAGHF